MKKAAAGVWVMCIMLILTALVSCPGEKPEPLPAKPCETRDTLSDVRRLFKDNTVQAHVITIAHDYVLSLYLLCPDLDPQAAGDQVVMNTRRAILFAARKALLIVNRLPCSLKLFSAVNPMIVDRECNVWYIDIIPLEIFGELQNPTDEELLNSIERNNADYHFRRNQRVRVQAPPPSSDYSAWRTIAPSLLTIIRDRPERIDTAAYYLVFNNEATVQVYWETLEENDADDGIIIQKIDKIRMALVSLWPRPDALEIYVTDPAGITRMFISLRGDVLNKKEPLKAKEVLLQKLF